MHACCVWMMNMMYTKFTNIHKQSALLGRENPRVRPVTNRLAAHPHMMAFACNDPISHAPLPTCDQAFLGLRQITYTHGIGCSL